MPTCEWPLVSILTPVYNGELYIRDCIESVLAQAYQDWEYTIVNNCSTDRTLEIISAYAQKDKRIRVYSNDKFVGVIENHNIAFSQISPRAKYCKVVSADDFIFPHCIKRMTEVAEANQSVGIVGAYQLSGSYVKWQGFEYPQTVFSGHDLCRKFLRGKAEFVQGQPIFGFGTPTSLLYRADLIRGGGGQFYPNSSPHADTSACFKCLNACDFGFVYEVLSFERIHEQTQTSTSRRIDRYNSAMLNDLIQYGPLYLTSKELDQRVRQAVRGYYESLGLSYVVGSRNKEFWHYHKARLEELGYPMKRSVLLKSAAVKMLREIVNPGQATKKLWSHIGRKTATAP